MDKVTLFPYDPFVLTPGLNIICLERAKDYFLMTKGLVEDVDTVVVSQEGTLLSVSKEVLFLGDIANPVNLETLFYKQAVKAFLDYLGVEEKSRLLEIQRQIQSEIQGDLYRSEIPLEVDSETDLKRIITSVKLKIEISDDESFFDRLQEIVSIEGALQEKRLLVLTHITQYCTLEQIQYIKADILRLGLQVLFLEDSCARIDMKDGRTHYVDKDCVQFS